MAISQMEGYLQNPYHCFSEEHVLFLLALKLNLKDKTFFCVKIKNNSNYTIKVAERSNCSFSIYFMNLIAQTSIFFNMFFIKHHFNRVYWFSKHLKYVRNSQASISINSCAGFSKIQLFSVSMVRINIMTVTFIVR